MAIALLLQAGPPAPAAIVMKPITGGDCPASPDPDAITVCGRRGANERFRLRPLPEVAEATLLPRAQTSVAGGTIGVEAESAGLAAGQISRRAMLRFKRPF